MSRSPFAPVPLCLALLAPTTACLSGCGPTDAGAVYQNAGADEEPAAPLPATESEPTPAEVAPVAPEPAPLVGDGETGMEEEMSAPTIELAAAETDEIMFDGAVADSAPAEQAPAEARAKPGGLKLLVATGPPSP